MYLNSINSKFPIKIRTGDIIVVKRRFCKVISINDKENYGIAKSLSNYIKFTPATARFKRRPT